MNELIEKIVDKLKGLKPVTFDVDTGLQIKMKQAVTFVLGKAIDIIHEEAEAYNDGWIPCSERLPEEAGNYLVTRIDGTVNMGMFVFFANRGFFNPYCDLLRFPDKEVVAWQPAPVPYQPKGE